LSGAEPVSRVRLDKWLWFARFFKTRSLAARTVAEGVRVNGARVTKPATELRPGDVVTFAQGAQTRVVRVEAPGVRRGPAPEAATLYDDLAPPVAATGARAGPRPTKRDRRALDRTQGAEPGGRRTRDVRSP
jgi:ribosome-associated heat shock protein Hsp15